MLLVPAERNGVCLGIVIAYIFTVIVQLFGPVPQPAAAYGSRTTLAVVPNCFCYYFGHICGHIVAYEVIAELLRTLLSGKRASQPAPADGPFFAAASASVQPQHGAVVEYSGIEQMVAVKEFVTERKIYHFDGAAPELLFRRTPVPKGEQHVAMLRYVNPCLTVFVVVGAHLKFAGEPRGILFKVGGNHYPL